jgi:hypothetical protein
MIGRTYATEVDGSGTITVLPYNEADHSALVVICDGLGGLFADVHRKHAPSDDCPADCCSHTEEGDDEYGHAGHANKMVATSWIVWTTTSRMRIAWASKNPVHEWNQFWKKNTRHLGCPSRGEKESPDGSWTVVSWFWELL